MEKRFALVFARAGAGRIALAVVILLLLGILMATVKLAISFPFTREKVLDALRKSSAREVKIQSFRKSYFPPGCVVGGVGFEHRRRKDLPPLITIQRLTIKASYGGLIGFRKRVDEVRVEGMRVLIPPRRTDGTRSQVFPLTAAGGDKNVGIARIDAKDVLLEFRTDKPGKRPYQVWIDQLTLHHVGANTPISFEASVRDSMPGGRIRSKGSFGPWDPDDPGGTSVNGSYTYDNAQLSDINGLAGTLSSQGKYSGPLGRLEVTGTAAVPDFRVAHGSHAAQLAADFKAVVNGEDGDTLLRGATIRFGRTTVLANGGVTGEPDRHGKLVSLDVIVRDGRIEDLLMLVTTAKTPAMTGEITLKAAVEMPSDSRPFLEKVNLRGDFGTAGGQFHSPRLQGSLNRLSGSARGENEDQQERDPRTALSGMRGHVVLKNGVATVSHVAFGIEGSTAAMDGTYNLLSEQIDLHGTLETNGKLSSATTGLKSVLVTLISPFFHKEHGAKVFPIKITGPYGDPKIALDIGGKK